jgi:hypothetical protein
MMSSGCCGINVLTLRVSCPVNAVMMLAGWHWWLMIASISAWMPAPPLGSWPEKHKTVGRFGDILKKFTGL